MEFLARQEDWFLSFKRREGGLNGRIADIIRLIGPQDVLQNWIRPLLMRQIFSVSSFLPTQESIDPVEGSKKSNANLGFARNDCISY